MILSSLSLGINRRRRRAAPVATAPAAFTEGMWSLNASGEATVEILPSDGGSAITDIEYRIGVGSAVSFGATDIGTYATTGAAADDIQIRAVNAAGSADWSDTLTVPAPSAATIAPVVYDLAFNNVTGAFSFNLSPDALPSDIYYLIGDDAVRTTAQIKAGTGADLFGTFEAVTGNESGDIDISSLPLEEGKYLHLFAENAIGTSDIDVVEFERGPAAFTFTDTFEDRTEDLVASADWFSPASGVIGPTTLNRIAIVAGGKAGFSRIDGSEFAGGLLADGIGATSRHQYIKATCTDFGNSLRLFARIALDGSDGYYAMITNEARVSIRKFVGYPGGTQTILTGGPGYVDIPGGMPSRPFDMMFEVDGSDLRVYINDMDTPLDSVTDSDFASGATQGFAVTIGTGRLSDNCFISSFEAGNL